MFLNDLVYLLSKLIENKIPEKYLIRFQEILLSSGIFTIAPQLLANVVLLIFILLVITIFLSILFSFDLIIAILASIAIPPGVLASYIFIKAEKRREMIEKASPDFLRQLSAMLRVGLSFENAMDELSKYGSGPLYDELRRTVIEIRIGRDFDETIIAMLERLKSKNLERTFKIILEARKSGGGLADIIDNVSEDLRSVNAIKRERRSSVMMAIMFLIISAIIAAPFALGMVGIYSAFMEELGKGSELIETAKIAAGSYIIIHSILAGFIIGLIMYGDLKKGIKFSIPLTLCAYSIFYLISNFGSAFLSF
ncbi:bacterial type II secretion system protein F domain protein [Methanobrevibacter cuticularis]|uniref:Bacterial type II secretion system protein F domain protein n=1 Tax=Methanobrevibacter cuticularis TaxID=47311 RepID=A0A166E4D9_9EURY|nr:type II secretion system F family protein [Methanobrevibacter cuticularis]KZX16268.1 bacterial type II secretion system protein F domain protein [Methanobrevibacter cuticularis]